MKIKNVLLEAVGGKKSLSLWFVFHAGVALFFVSVFAASKGAIGIDTDLFNMLPKSFSDEEAVRIADEKLTEITAQNVFVIAESSSFDSAKSAAEKAYARLEGSSNFKSISLYSGAASASDSDGVSEILSLLERYKFNLLDDKSVELINDSPDLFAQEAIGKAFSPFTIVPTGNEEIGEGFEKDPFMLKETIAQSYLKAAQSSGTAMSAKEGVIACQSEGLWYVMIRGILSKQGAALASEKNGVAQIYSACAEAQEEVAGVNFIYSGSPFNSHKSSNSAMKEITVISSVCIVVVLIMLLTVFKSFVPIAASLASIFVSVFTAFIATVAVFGKIHILALVFGTSLIGSCIDYSLHFFARRAADKSIASGFEIRRKLLPGLSMAILSSVLCYAILLFAPFNLLKQMSVFSIVGLVSSFLTTICLYPFIPLPSRKKTLSFLRFLKPARDKALKRLIGRAGITALFVLSIGTLFISRGRFSIQNDLTRLYTMEGKLLEDQIKTVKITQYAPSCWFVVRGEDENALLANEERLLSRIDALTEGKAKYMAVSLFVPSKDKQTRSRSAVKRILPLAASQYEILGFDADESRVLSAELEQAFFDSEGDFFSLSSDKSPALALISDALSSFWLGEVNGKFYSVVMPNMVKDSDALRALAEDDENIFFTSKMADMSRDLDRLTIMILKFFACAYVLMFVILKFFYKLKQTLKIVSVPILIVLITSAVFALLKIDLEFFSVTGMILVFGLGLDYIIYMIENEKLKNKIAEKGESAKPDEAQTTIEPFATLLSFLTTVISFGALALSSFAPVHLIGLSIFTGLTTAYISTMLYDRSL